MQTLMVERNGSASAKAQLIDYLREAIRNNRFRPGDKLPTTQEFVRTAGVSSNTVRLAMAELVREGTLKAIPGMGTFVVDKKAQAKSSPVAVKRIALFPVFHQTGITMLQDAYRAESVRGFLEECERSRAVASVMPSELISGGIEEVESAIEKSGTQGLVWLYPEPPEWKIIDYLFDRDFPMVVTRRSNIDSDVAFVGADYERAGFDYGRQIISNGCRKVILFNHFEQHLYIDSQRHCGWPIGIKQGLSRAFEMLTGSSEGCIEQYSLQGFTEKQNETALSVVEKSEKNSVVLFTNSYHLYNVFLANQPKMASLFKDRRLAVIGNKIFLVNFLPFVKEIEVDVLVDPFKEIAQCAAQKLAALLDGYFARTTTLVNIEIKKISELALSEYAE